jgi:hypothetical protein
METEGILYIAAGEKYIRAAIRAAESVRKYCPGLSIHLFADWQNYQGFDFDQNPFPFTSAENISNPHRRSKVDYLPLTPFDRTLYLDTDTRLNDNITSIFSVLERFDIALAHDYHRNTQNSLGAWRIELPQAFPPFNGGVILYRKTPAVIEFLKSWSDNYKEAGLRHDQPTLRELLWLSNLRLATLPPEYNVRYIKYHFLWSKSEAVTKIFHLKQFHMGWLTWSRRFLLGIARKLGLGKVIDLIISQKNRAPQ